MNIFMEEARKPSVTEVHEIWMGLSIDAHLLLCFPLPLRD